MPGCRAKGPRPARWTPGCRPPCQQYGERAGSRNPSPPPQEEQGSLKALGRRLDWAGAGTAGGPQPLGSGELKAAIAKARGGAARNRWEAARFSPWHPQPVLDSLERATGQLTQEIEEVQGAAGRQLRQSAHWRQQAELLASIPGVGERTAALLLSEMPPVERCASAKNWAAFCGPAPEPRQPGKGSYSRLSRMGRARVRAGLCLPATSALRWNPVVRDLGRRPKEREKQGGRRIVAAMHKLPRICFGVLKGGQPFEPQKHQTHVLEN